jgi:5'-AMP-activated protein kinase regulatory beta subunit
VHQYKFIVDGEWRFSPDDPTTPDEQGNINNFVDTTNYEPTTDEITGAGSTTKAPKTKTVESRTNRKRTTEVSTEISFADEAPLIPQHLLSSYFLNVS